MDETLANPNLPSAIDVAVAAADQRLPGLAQLEQQVAAITSQIFSGTCNWETGFDPAFPEHTWRVVNVDVEGDLPSIAARKNEWHRRVIEELGEQSMHFTLCVYPVNSDR